jgi:ribosomal protein S12 methylthiotransferase accessory factor
VNTIARRQRLERLLGLWEQLVDSKVGIIREVQELPIDDDDPDFFHFLSTSCNTARFTSLRNFGNNGGVSTDRYVALAKAVGEGIERYCSAVFDYDDLEIAPFEALEERAVKPADFALYRPDQLTAGTLPWQQFRDDVPVAWTQGVSLHDGERVLVPAAMVFVPYHYQRSRGDAAIVQPISTGLAAGCSFAEAALSGLCECIERDAFTITWQAHLSRPRIELSTVPPSCRQILERYREVNLDVKVMDITSDLGVPTLLTIAVGRSPSSPAIAVAAATDPDPETALTKSLEELAHTRKFAKQLMDYTPEIVSEVQVGHPSVQDQKDHLRFYCPQHAREWAEFTWASEDVRPFASIQALRGRTTADVLERVVVRIAAAGLEAVACDLTTEDVRALGLSVVRVVVPGLHPLFMGHQNRALGGSRLYTVPQRLGCRGLNPFEPDNPYPHPFP